MKYVATFFLLICATTLVSAQIFQEDFTGFTTGINLDGQGSWKWAATSGTLHLTVDNASPLTYAGYNMGGGNYAVMPNGATGSCRSYDTTNTRITSFSNSTFYISFLLNLTQAHTNSVGYFLTLGNNAGSTSYLAPKVFADSVDATHYVLGLSKTATSTATGLVWGTTPLTYNSTHLVVVRYTFHTPGITWPLNCNDQAWLWIDLIDSSVEPDTLGAECQSWSASSTYLDTTGMYKDRDFDGYGTPSEVGTIIWHNRSLTNPAGSFDGLRIGWDPVSANAWSNLNPGPLPVQMTTVSVTANRLTAQLHWSTATEANNYGFDVERKTSTTGWTKVGFVAGAGTSNSLHNYSYTDNVPQAGVYEYRIKQIDKSGTFKYSRGTQIDLGSITKVLSLGSNYPNPFNPTTNIEFAVPTDGKVVLKVYNVLGQEVATLFDGNAVAGQLNKASFNASRLPSGVYFSRMEFGGTSIVKRMMLVK